MPIKFICLSDTHGDAPPEMDEGQAVAWLHAGDLCDRGMTQIGDPRVPQLTEWFERRKAPVYIVQGNHDCGRGKAFLARHGKDISGMVVEITPRLFVAGIGWADAKHFDTPDETALGAVCDEVLSRARTYMTAGDRCLLLTHYPAKFPRLFRAAQGGGAPGFDCIRKLAGALRPLAILQGHVHEWFSTQAVFKDDGWETLVVNPGPAGGVLTVDLEQCRALFEARSL